MRLPLHVVSAALRATSFFAMSCAASASLLLPKASAEHPAIACILPTLAESARAEGKLLPEIVRVIGVTPIEDGERLKVLRAGEFNPNRWQPWPKESIHFGAICGVEAGAYRDLDAERGSSNVPRKDSRPDRPR